MPSHKPRLSAATTDLQRLRASLDEAEAEIARGNFIEWGRDTMAQISREAAEDERRGLPLDPDVLPVAMANQVANTGTDGAL